MTGAARYALALTRLPGVGRRTAVLVLERFPDEESLAAASEPALFSACGARAARALMAGLATGWAPALDWANDQIERHERSGVVLVPFGGSTYPALLARSPDPPVLLFVRGDVSALDAALPVAVVGTRHPTRRGREIARRLGVRLAEMGAVVVSGLAQGIDTAGHEGALEAGRTVAVLGTAIDQIYPAENKALAGRIESRGALVSEYAMGAVGRADAFVERDRIQAGLSVAIIPVQTRLKGGTQHTIKFAFEAGRRVLCPRPADAEIAAPENEGILDLVRDGRATLFDAADLPRLRADLVALRDALMTEPPVAAAARRAKGARRKQSMATEDASTLGLLPDDPIRVEPSRDAGHAGPAYHTIDEVIAALDDVLSRMGPAYDQTAFDDIVRHWRRRRYPRD